MGLRGTKKVDPLSQRARTLNAEIASLESQIRALDAQLQQGPRWRSTVRPNEEVEEPAPAPEPVFERVDHARVTAQSEAAEPPPSGAELGVRKSNLAAAWRRFTQHFKGPTASNPKLINYLAAGSIKGLRPLRYEKRVARNRVIALTVLLVAVLWGIIAALLRH
jgi:hypothetical protein